MEVFKARCSQLSSIMSNPVGGSNMDKYNDCLEAIKEAESKLAACSERSVETKRKLKFKLTQLQIKKIELEKVKDEITLSKTCLGQVEIWLKEKIYGRTFEIDTLPIRKGNETEIEATALVSAFLGVPFVRDNRKLENDYLTGHLDIDWKEERKIIDTKVCKDFSTFPILDKEIETAYYGQGQGYMCLTGYNECLFAKCAINTPQHELERLEKGKWFALMDLYGDEDSEFFKAEMDDFMRNLFMRHVVDNNIQIKGYCLDTLRIPEIPKSERVKIISVKRDQDYIDLIEPRVKEINAFLRQIKIKP